MRPNGDLVAAYIQDVREKALASGKDGLTDREFQALMTGWQVDQLKELLGAPDTAPTMLDRAKQVGVPAVATGGVLAIMLKILELFGK